MAIRFVKGGAQSFDPAKDNQFKPRQSIGKPTATPSPGAAPSPRPGTMGVTVFGQGDTPAAPAAGTTQGQTRGIFEGLADYAKRWREAKGSKKKQDELIKEFSKGLFLGDPDIGQLTVPGLTPTGAAAGAIGTLPTARAGGAYDFPLRGAEAARIGKEMAQPWVKEVMNAKKWGLVTNTLAKAFSPPAVKFYGFWAGSVIIGMWGYAESPEGVSITENIHLIDDARRTGDWSAVDEAEAYKREILDLGRWRTLILSSPISGFVGIANKIKGAIFGAKVMTRHIEDSKFQQANNLTEQDMWNKIRTDQAAEEKAQVDYFNDERIRVELELNNIKKATADAERTERIKQLEEERRLWIEHRRKIIDMERKAAQESADFWLAYTKKRQEMIEDFSPSKLNFGLL